MTDQEIEARATEYARILRRFTETELSRAYDDVMQTWTNLAWPPPGCFAEAAWANRKAFGDTRSRAVSEPEDSGVKLDLETVDRILNEYPQLSDRARHTLRNFACDIESTPYNGSKEKPEKWPKDMTVQREGGSAAYLLNTPTIRQISDILSQE